MALQQKRPGNAAFAFQSPLCPPLDRVALYPTGRVKRGVGPRVAQRDSLSTSKQHTDSTAPPMVLLPDHRGHFFRFQPARTGTTSRQTSFRVYGVYWQDVQEPRRHHPALDS